MIHIHYKFLNLKTEKKERIINAAMQEFIKNGYDNASTNEIVKQANISKGSLFNYFKNKKDLYFYLLDYSIEVSYEIFDRMDWTETDIIKRFQRVAIVKLDMLKKYPEIFNFAKAVYDEQSPDVKEEIIKKFSEINQNSFQKLYENIDLTLFKDGIDITKAINIIQWTLEKHGETEYQKIKHLKLEDYNSRDNFIEEMNEYLAIMKQCFYK